jgi:hypothetical protein
MATEHIPVEVACRVLDVSTSGYYAWLSRPPSARSIRQAWLTDLIVQVHQDSRGTYGALRVHAELRLGRGIVVGRNAVALLMRSAGLAGAMGRPKWRHAKPDQIAGDLVDRQFARGGPNQLWVTDITEHATREGKVYCAVVLDVFSRRVVGWSIDASPTAGLVTNALGIAIQTRTPPTGAITHSDQGVQPGFNRSLQHCLVGSRVDGRWRLRLAFQSRVLRGRLLSAAATASGSSRVCLLRAVPLGKYWRSSPLVFSLVPRCQGPCGSQKNTCRPLSMRS